MAKNFLLPLLFAGIIAVINAQYYTEGSGYGRPYGEYGGYHRQGYDAYRSGVGNGYPTSHSQSSYRGGYSPEGYYSGYPSVPHSVGRYPIGGHYSGGYPTIYLQ